MHQKVSCGWLAHRRGAVVAARLITALYVSAIFSVALLTTSAHAVVVLPKGASQPIMGYVVREDERTIVVRQPLPDGKSRENSFLKRDLDEVIVTVSPQRLAGLEPNKPELYLEYAEELAEKQRDPEARDAAIRLYAIAAARGDVKLRHSALLGLISLARSAEEKRLFQAAAFLFDPDHDASVLVSPAADFDLSWSAVVKNRGTAPLPTLDLNKLTEFDPEFCIYRGGKWVKP